MLLKKEELFFTLALDVFGGGDGGVDVFDVGVEDVFESVEVGVEAHDGLGFGGCDCCGGGGGG